MSKVGCSEGWGGGYHAYHNYQGCWSYEAPDEVGVQAKPATVMGTTEIKEGKKEDGEYLGEGGFEVIAFYTCSENIHQMEGWDDTEEQALQNTESHQGTGELWTSERIWCRRKLLTSFALRTEMTVRSKVMLQNRERDEAKSLKDGPIVPPDWV